MTATRFTTDHEYVRVDGDIGVVGVTDYAQSQLGDIVFIELPSVGKRIAKGEQLATVESVKAASEAVFAHIWRSRRSEWRTRHVAGDRQRRPARRGLVREAASFRA